MRLIDADLFISDMQKNIQTFEMSASEIAKTFYIPYFKQMIEEIRRRPTIQQTENNNED